MTIKTVGVIGAGQMGNGIAHIFALSGHDVLLNDVNTDALGAAKDIIKSGMDRQVSRDIIKAADASSALDRIETTGTLSDLGKTDLIIEAATEKEAVKHAIFEGLRNHLEDHTILTSNTSSISITRLAAATDRPERFMGFHFMNPVPIMQLVELIRGIATNDETFQTLKALVAKIGKTSATAEDFPAFIVNRILMPMINEAIYALYEGVGTVEDERPSAVSTIIVVRHPFQPGELLTFSEFIGHKILERFGKII